MDPLSVAASVAGLVSLTFEISQTVGHYYKAVKDAPKSIQEIQQELSLMHSTLQQLEDLLRGPHMSRSSFAQSSVLTTAVFSCIQINEEISAKLAQPKPDRLSRSMEALKWPFSEKEVQKKLETLRRYTSTFQFSLNVEGCKLLSQTSKDATTTLEVQLDISRKVLQLTKDIGMMAESAREASRLSSQIADINVLVNTFHDTSSRIQDISDDVRALALMSQQTKEKTVLDWLSSISYSHKHSDIRSRRLPGTGQWLLDCKVFQGWLKLENPVLWCTGGPGVGKSCLTYVPTLAYTRAG
ncbi:hypothetical protein BDR22DRAFT_877766 [Usnea florida]